MDGRQNIVKGDGVCGEGNLHAEAPRALHIHEVAVGHGHKALHLVLALLSRNVGLKEIILHL